MISNIMGPQMRPPNRSQGSGPPSMMPGFFVGGPDRGFVATGTMFGEGGVRGGQQLPNNPHEYVCPPLPASENTDLVTVCSACYSECLGQLAERAKREHHRQVHLISCNIS